MVSECIDSQLSCEKHLEAVNTALDRQTRLHDAMYKTMASTVQEYAQEARTVFKEIEQLRKDLYDKNGHQGDITVIHQDINSHKDDHKSLKEDCKDHEKRISKTEGMLYIILGGSVLSLGLNVYDTIKSMSGS